MRTIIQTQEESHEMDPHFKHELDEVQPGDQFRDWVLDLQPRVHFQEVEVAVLVHQKLDRPGGLITDRLCQLHRLLAHGLSRPGVQESARGFFDDLRGSGRANSVGEAL
jgi:hypothetical protein